MALAHRRLTAHIFADVEKKQEGPIVRALAVSATTAYQQMNLPVVVVVTDELGNELRRSSYGKVTAELQERVNKRFPINGGT